MGGLRGFVDPLIPLPFVIVSLFQWLAHSIKLITAGNGGIQEIIISHTSILSVWSQLKDGFLLDRSFLNPPPLHGAYHCQLRTCVV